MYFFDFYIISVIATSCADLKQRSLASKDGEYFIYARAVKVFSHAINTSHPKEFITLSAGVESNYTYMYANRLPHRPYSAKYKCSGKHGTSNYSKAGLTKFRKVRLVITKMVIIRDDFTFAQSEPFGRRIAYGSAGDCYLLHYASSCRRGHFKVDLTDTGLRFKASTQWQAIGFSPGIEMHDYKMSKDRTLFSTKCGGWCGKCRPIGEMSDMSRIER